LLFYFKLTVIHINISTVAERAVNMNFSLTPFRHHIFNRYQQLYGLSNKRFKNIGKLPTVSKALITGTLCLFALQSNASETKKDTIQVHYLGNEALMVQSEQNKVMFDTFFNKKQKHFISIPNKMSDKIFNQDAPFDSVGNIFVSHYHHDHFNAKDTVTYLKSAPQVQLFAPKQAVDKLSAQPEYSKIVDQVISLSLGINDKAKHFEVNGMQIEVLRVAHAFGEEMKGVENIIYRVTMENGLTVMHFGDAETSLDYYKKFKTFFQKKNTHHVFLPHIFAVDEHDENAIKKTFNANAITYMHVPVSFLSDEMIDKKDFFTEPSDIRTISQKIQ